MSLAGSREYNEGMRAIRIHAALIALLIGGLIVGAGYFSGYLHREELALWLLSPGLMVFAMTGGVHGSYRFSGFSFITIWATLGWALVIYGPLVWAGKRRARLRGELLDDVGDRNEVRRF